MEYTIILGVVITITLAFTSMVKRGTQGMIKTVADQIGYQKNAEQDFNKETGYMSESFQPTDVDSKKYIKEGRLQGTTDIFYDDKIRSYSSTNSILGFVCNGEIICP